jgi:putative heme iron utilization protein
MEHNLYIYIKNTWKHFENIISNPDNENNQTITFPVAAVENV